MRNITLVFSTVLILFVSEKLVGQVYYQFPTTDAVWNQVSNNYFNTPDTRKIYSLNGDTIINTKTYSKVYGLYDTTLVYSDSLYYAALREDSLKRVYILFDGIPEILLYDFSLNIGDTIFYEYGGYASHENIIISSQNHYKVVTDVDSILLINNQYRKRYELAGNLFGIDYWVEGIGSTEWVGLLNPLVTDVILGGDNYYLACCRASSEVLFLNNPSCFSCFCELYLNNNDIINNSNSIEIFPNPFKETTTITLNKNEVYNITLFDIRRQKNRQINNVKDEQFIIYREDLTSGIYFLEIKNSKGIIEVKKLIVE